MAFRNVWKLCARAAQAGCSCFCFFCSCLSSFFATLELNDPLHSGQVALGLRRTWAIKHCWHISCPQGDCTAPVHDSFGSRHAGQDIVWLVSFLFLLDEFQFFRMCRLLLLLKAKVSALSIHRCLLPSLEGGRLLYPYQSLRRQHWLWRWVHYHLHI